MNTSMLLPRKSMLLIALLQGMALLFLYRSLENDTWPSQSPLWAYPLWTISVAFPVLLLLSLEKQFLQRTMVMVGGFVAVLGLLAVYTGSQAEPFGTFPVGNMTFVFVCSTGLACFKALMYLQQRAARIPLTYKVLFGFSWRNSLTLALSLLFVFVFWLLLMLWAQLFRAIDVDFFHELFREDWFLFPVLSVSLGLAIIIFRNLTQVIDGITRLLQGLIKLLLPLIIVIAALFLLALPMVGLDALWETGNGTSLLLWLLAGVLFFTNAVYQDGRGDKPYPLVIHRVIYAGLLLLPIISVMSLYGLYLRLDEYGLTIARSWAFVVWLVLSLFAVGYCAGIVRKRDEWTEDLARVNTGMGMVVLVLMLLANSPVLDFRKLSISSQLQRIESGEIALAEFDFWYARDSLARPGYLATRELKEQVDPSNTELLDKIDNPRPVSAARYLRTTTEFWENVLYRPERFEIPPDLRRKIESEPFVSLKYLQAVLVRIDLDSDGANEFVIVSIDNNYIYQSQVYFNQAGQWISVRGIDIRTGDSDLSTGESIRSGEISLQASRFANLRLGDLLIRPADGQDVPLMPEPEPD